MISSTVQAINAEAVSSAALQAPMKKWRKTIDIGKRFAKKQALACLPEWILIPLRKRHYLRVLKNVSDAYDPDFSVIRHLVKPGDHVIDLGAHVGACSKFLSDLVGDNGRVYSVEPFPSNFDILSFNIRKLGLSNVELINFAVSERSGTLRMEVPTFAEFGESFYDARLILAGAESSLRQAEVEVSTIDSLFADLPRQVSFVKCDVEGQELQALRGAANLVEKHKPAWLLEISLMDPPTHEQVRELMCGHGYEEFCFADGKLRLWQRGHKPVDVFFLQPAHLEAAQGAGLA
jgi:FkbM family methyltransferase